MRVIETSELTNKIKEMLLEACTTLPKCNLSFLKKAQKNETSEYGKYILEKIIENDELAIETKDPICQDTGIVTCFLEIGLDVHFTGDIYEAVNEGVRQAYKDGYFRKSVVNNPLIRKNSNDNTPAIVHIKLIPGDQVKIEVAPKGAGSENMSFLKMMIPSDGVENIKKLVLDAIKNFGGKPCPPIIVGIGIGGNFEKCAIMAKEALLREIDDHSDDPTIARLESELLEEINKLGIGPMGFGGKTTCLGVKINTFPCHIASLPIAVNIQCHAARHVKSYL